jgi:hypothetical protein
MAARAMYLAAKEAHDQTSAALEKARDKLAEALAVAGGVSVGALVEYREYRAGKMVWAVYQVSSFRLGYSLSTLHLRGRRRLKNGSFGAIENELYRDWRLPPAKEVSEVGV